MANKNKQLALTNSTRSLSHFEVDTLLPHLVNVDEDPFRHNRFVYLLKKRVTVFGPQGDVQPMSLRWVVVNSIRERRAGGGRQMFWTIFLSPWSHILA